MFRNIIFFGLVFLCFESFGMKSISINMQGVDSRNLMARVDPVVDDPVISLRDSSGAVVDNSIRLNDGVFSIVLIQNVFSQKFVSVVNQDNNEPLFSVVVEKTHADCQPTVSLIKAQNIHCALYRQRAGGGNAFILAIGDQLEKVSIQAVKSKQHYGKMQALTLVSQL